MLARAFGDPGGKLKAVAQAWAKGRGAEPEADDDPLTAQAPPALVRAEVEIGPDEVDAVALFLALGTQWRWHPAAGLRVGMIYEAVAPTAAGLGLMMTPSLFTDLRVMEAAAMLATATRD